MRLVGPRSVLAPLLVVLAGCGDEPPAGGARPVSSKPSRTGMVPAPVEWGSTACSSCEMVLVRKEFGAQCLDAEGHVLEFDDLGCMLIEMGMGRLVPGSIHFRDQTRDRWIPLAAAGFVRNADTPMGFGFAAVQRGDGTLSFDEVRGELAARFELRSFPPDEAARR